MFVSRWPRSKPVGPVPSPSVSSPSVAFQARWSCSARSSRCKRVRLVPGPFVSLQVRSSRSEHLRLVPSSLVSLQACFDIHYALAVCLIPACQKSAPSRRVAHVKMSQDPVILLANLVCHVISLRTLSTMPRSSRSRSSGQNGNWRGTDQKTSRLRWRITTSAAQAT
jgi:hypothetical protein